MNAHVRWYISLNYAFGPGTIQERTVVLHVECVFGSALTEAEKGFVDTGGQELVIEGSFPSAGVMKLEQRGGSATGDVEECQMELFLETTPKFDVLGCEIADVQPSVDLFILPSSVHVDAAEL